MSQTLDSYLEILRVKKSWNWFAQVVGKVKITPLARSSASPIYSSFLSPTFFNAGVYSIHVPLIPNNAPIITGPHNTTWQNTHSSILPKLSLSKHHPTTGTLLAWNNTGQLSSFANSTHNCSVKYQFACLCSIAWAIIPLRFRKKISFWPSVGKVHSRTVRSCFSSNSNCEFWVWMSQPEAALDDNPKSRPSSPAREARCHSCFAYRGTVTTPSPAV